MTRYVEIECPECGSWFWQPEPRDANYRRKYCSRECRNDASSRMQRAAWQAVHRYEEQQKERPV